MDAVVAYDCETADQMAAQLLGTGCAVGLDTEWNAAREVALLQLAGQGGCLLCMLPELDLQQCPNLLQLLSNPQIIKAGIGADKSFCTFGTLSESTDYGSRAPSVYRSSS